MPRWSTEHFRPLRAKILLVANASVMGGEPQGSGSWWMAGDVSGGRDPTGRPNGMEWMFPQMYHSVEEPTLAEANWRRVASRGRSCLSCCASGSPPANPPDPTN